MNIKDQTALPGTGPVYRSEIRTTYQDPEHMPTLRDQFAMAALSGMTLGADSTYLQLAELAYCIADKMLEARKKGQAE